MGTPFPVHSEGGLLQCPCTWQGSEDNRKPLPPTEGKPNVAQACLDSEDAIFISAGRLGWPVRGCEVLPHVPRRDADTGRRGPRTSEHQPRHKGPDAAGRLHASAVLCDPRKAGFGQKHSFSWGCPLGGWSRISPVPRLGSDLEIANSVCAPVGYGLGYPLPPPPIHIYSEPQNVTLFGNGIWLEISGKTLLDLAWALRPMSSVLIRGGEDTGTQRRPFAYRGRQVKESSGAFRRRGPCWHLIWGFSL